MHPRMVSFAIFLTALAWNAAFQANAERITHSMRKLRQNLDVKQISSSSSSSSDEEETEECSISSKISCFVIESGKPCTEIITHHGSCEPIEVYYKFSYCNDDEESNPHFFTLRGEISIAQGKLLSEPIYDDALAPQRCRVLGHQSVIDSCARVYEASMELSVYSYSYNEREEAEGCTSRTYYKVVKPLNQQIE